MTKDQIAQASRHLAARVRLAQPAVAFRRGLVNESHGLMEQIDGDVIEHSDTHLVFKGIGTDLVMTYKLVEPIKKPSRTRKLSPSRDYDCGRPLPRATMHRMRRALPLAIFIACQTPPPPPAQVRPPDLGTRPDMAVKRFMPKTMGEARTLALMSDWEQRMGHDRALDLMLEASAYIRRRASEIEYSLHRPVLDKDGRAADVARELRDLRQLVTRKHKDPAAARRAIMAEMGNELGVVVMGTEFEPVQKQADIFMAIGLAR